MATQNDKLLTSEERGQLSLSAAGFHERTASSAESGTEMTKESMQVFDTWWSSIAGSSTASLKRLELSELTTQEAVNRLALNSDELWDELPNWVSFSEDLLRHILDRNLPPRQNRDNGERPFDIVLNTISTYGIQQIDWGRHDLIAESAVADLETILLDRLEQLLARPLFANFQSYKNQTQHSSENGQTQTYNQFVEYFHKGGCKQFVMAFPVAARLTITLIDNWVTSTREFLSRLSKDVDSLSSMVDDIDTTGGVTDIEAVGDFHHGGRCALRVGTETGSIAYKPRHVEPESRFNQFLQWVNETSSLPRYETLECIVRDGYGWMEWIECDECHSTAEVSEFYERAGGLMCLLYLLAFSDGHLENVIAHGTQPVVVDLETIGEPRLRNDTDSSVDALEPMINQSIVRTGFLPANIKSIDMASFGGLARDSAKHESTWDWKFTEVNTPQMELYQSDPIELVGDNLPRLDGESILPEEYAEEIIAGFEQAYRFLLQNKEDLVSPTGPLSVFDDITCRYLFRSTKSYQKIIRRMTGTDSLADGINFECEIEELSKPFATGKLDEALWPLFRREIDDLWNLDVPRFETNTADTALFHRGTRITSDVLSTTPLERIRQQARSLDEADLKRQIDYLRVAYDPESIHPTINQTLQPVNGESTDIDRSYEDTARYVASTILDHRLENESSLQWSQRKQYQDTGFYLQQVDDSFFEGRWGIAVLFAGLAAETESTMYEQLSRNLTNSILESRPEEADKYGSVGGAAGLGGDIYALLQVGTLLNDDEFINTAKELATGLSETSITDHDEMDIIHGTAGLALALLAVYHRTGDTVALKRAITVCDGLLDEALETEQGTRWRTTRSQRITDGYAHGTAGICHALARAGVAADKQRFVNTAVDAVCSISVKDVCPEDADACPEGWAAGKAGVGTGLVGIYQATGASEITEKLREVYQVADTASLATGDDLYQGNAGRVEWLNLAAKTLLDDQIRQEAHELMDAVVHRANRASGYEIPWQSDNWQNPVLFRGMAGLGYTALRLHNPDLPSVVLWEE